MDFDVCQLGRLFSLFPDWREKGMMKKELNILKKVTGKIEKLKGKVKVREWDN